MRVEMLTITKRFGDLYANNDVSATFEPGQVHGLLGENGAGKSTLMKVLAGWYIPEAGAVRLDARDVVIRSPQDALALGIGYVPQDPQDFPDLTIIEHLVVGRSGWRVDRVDLVRRVEQVNQSLGFDLPPLGRVKELTVGQRLQLAMAQVVIQGAKVIILDEPPMGSGLRDSLKQLAGEGKTVVFITHNIADALEQCDQITVLRRGRRIGTVARPIVQADLMRMMFEEQLPPAGRPQQASERELIRLASVDCRTIDPPLAGINLAVRGGEVVGLAGIEGSGQASLLSLLAGRAKPTTGARACQAKRVHLVPAGRLGEGLVDGFTAEEMLSLAHPGAATDGGWRLSPQAMRTLTEKSIAQFHIKGQPASQGRSLSGGNQQRLMLAATPHDTDLLLLDNPTRGLDVPTAGFIWSWILDQCQRGAGVVVASNELEELWEHANRIVVMARGRLVGEVVPGVDSIDTLKQLMVGAT
ncbi:MAG: ATP-binding cassette domain-containing protein [Anaerolineae bacterium]|nr:ATP-binding cassette domain-containing protein [Anaerolineae bacterium]